MDYKTLYEIDFGNYQFQLILIPIVIIFIGIISARLIKRNGFSLPSWIPRFYSQGFLNNYTRFFSILVTLFGFIFLIVFLIKIPISIIDKNEIKNAIEDGNVMIVKGKVTGYSPVSDSNVDSEKFSINNVNFEYSENEDTYGYHTTTNQNKIIKENGQDLKITYYRFKGKNIILKIEELINY